MSEVCSRDHNKKNYNKLLDIVELNLNSAQVSYVKQCLIYIILIYRDTLKQPSPTASLYHFSFFKYIEPIVFFFSFLYQFGLEISSLMSSQVIHQFGFCNIGIELCFSILFDISIIRNKFLLLYMYSLFTIISLVLGFCFLRFNLYISIESLIHEIVYLFYYLG